MHDRSFPPPGGRAQSPAMASIPRQTRSPARVADVHLRGPAPRRARVHWPAAGGRPALVVVFASAADVELVDRLLERTGAVVLAVSAAHVVEAHATLAWAA